MSPTYYQLQNSHLTLTIHTHGAELISLKDNLTHTEYIWQADPTYWKRHSPVLFPIVGSLKNKSYSYNTQTYPLSQHGFARDSVFTLKSQTENEIWMTLTASPHTLKLYPFNFCLEIGYKLTERTVTVFWKVINHDTKKMYFSIGAHPAFSYQSASTAPRYLLFDSQKNLSYQLLDENGLLLPKLHTLKLTNGCHQIEEDLFDQDALIIEHHQAQQVSLADENKKPYITVSFDSPLFGLWSPAKKSAPFMCIEPWYGRCDAADFTGTLEERAYGQALAPQECFSSNYHNSSCSLA